MEQGMQGTEVTPEVKPKYPTISNDDKLALREAQFVVINTQEQAQTAINAAVENLNKVVQYTGQKYGVDPVKTQINKVSLAFVDAL